jgi:nucleotide-binding universal stress UspA family protein
VFETIVVPLDGASFAERALEPAARLARDIGAELVAMMVVGQPDYEQGWQYLERLTATVDVPTRTPYLLVADDPAECVANAGEAPGALIVMTSHARSRAPHAVLGSVAEKVVRELVSPVLVIGPRFAPTETWPRGRVVVPLDGSETAEAILPAVREWCATLGSDAWMVSVVDPADDLSDTGADAGYVRHVAERLERDGVRTGWDVLHDSDPACSIVTYAADQAEVIAMATHGRTGLGRIALGSVAARVLHEATCPVLVLRPEKLDPGGSD